MLRPIDTQILYPQLPELSNREQIDNQKPYLQQNVFIEKSQEEAVQKRETVGATNKEEKVEDHKQKQQQQQTYLKKQANKKSTKNKPSKISSDTTIDIRI